MSAPLTSKPHPITLSTSFHPAPAQPCQAAELTILRQRLLDRRRHGAQSVIKHMEKLDRYIAEIQSSIPNIKPNSLKYKMENSDPMLRRLVYLKTNDLISRLVDVMRQVANVNTVLELTDENTKLPPEPTEVTQAYEEVCKGILEEIYYEKKRADHSKIVMFDLLDLMVDAQLKGEMINIHN